MDINTPTTAAIALAPLCTIGSLALTNALDSAIDRVCFDRRFNVRTTPPSFGPMRFFGGDASTEGYAASPVRAIRSIIGALPIDYADYQFIDIGSGRGRTILVASAFGFKRCLGIEHAADLNDSANANIRAWRMAVPAAPEIESVCMDAASFEFPTDPSVVYFYNPFDNAVMARVADNLSRSYRRCPRKIYLINFHPRRGNPLPGLPFVERISLTGAATEFFEIFQTKDIG